MENLIERLKDALGPNGALEGADIGEAYRQDFGRFRNAAPRLVIRPASTEQVSRVMAMCNEAAQPIVAQGGMTGLVLGSLRLPLLLATLGAAELDGAHFAVEGTEPAREPPAH